MATTLLSIPDDIMASKTLKPLVEQANEWVMDIIATWPTPVTVEWYRVSNSPSDVVGLRLIDKYAKVDGLFRTKDLGNSYSFHGQLSPVLSALTQASLDEIQKQTRLSLSSAGAN